MKLLVTAIVLGALVPSLSWALPVQNGGGARCQCACRSASDFKDLDWLKTKSCASSNGASCTFWKNGKQQSGTLKDCSECRAGDSSTEWICKASWVKMRAPHGTLHQMSPAPRPPGQQSTAPAEPPSRATPH